MISTCCLTEEWGPEDFYYTRLVCQTSSLYMYIKNNLLPLFIPFQAVHTASVALQTYESKIFKKHTKQILETGFLFENQSFNGHIYIKSTPKYNRNSYFVMTLHNVTSGVNFRQIWQEYLKFCFQSESLDEGLSDMISPLEAWGFPILWTWIELLCVLLSQLNPHYFFGW